MKKSLLLILAACVLSLGTLSCSKDDDPGTKNNSGTTFTVNNTEISSSDIFYTVCQYSNALRETIFEVNFAYDDDTYSFNISLPSVKSVDDLETGDTFDADDFYVNTFYSMYGSYVGFKDYQTISGKVSVKSKSENKVVLNFSNFKFNRQLGNNEDIFTINGPISYNIYR